MLALGGIGAKGGTLPPLQPLAKVTARLFAQPRHLAICRILWHESRKVWTCGSASGGYVQARKLTLQSSLLWECAPQ